MTKSMTKINLSWDNDPTTKMMQLHSQYRLNQIQANTQQRQLHRQKIKFLQYIRQHNPQLYQAGIKYHQIKPPVSAPQQLSVNRCDQMIEYIKQQQSKKINQLIDDIQHQDWY